MGTDDAARWTYALVDEGEALVRVEVTDEDGAMLPVARQVSRGQAELLIQRIRREARSSGKPIKSVIRDPYFMASTVITIKRQPI